MATYCGDNDASDLDEDVNACYRCGANTYIRKPSTFKDLVHVMETLKNYWFDIAVLPH